MKEMEGDSEGKKEYSKTPMSAKITFGILAALILIPLILIALTVIFDIIQMSNFN
ncbi:hypothetical protein [Coraliomargarita parva]|uniref:hypothetical protein n=1 Tax=Coraliomargarita parva TaxID=3014050 RepID=UPI0022B52CAA|nr:hypothetical protein [Coraliomargarita parva]